MDVVVHPHRYNDVRFSNTKDLLFSWCGAQGGTRTRSCRDFKSLVSANFTTWAIRLA